MEKKIRIILTGATGFVGEGVLFACLVNPLIEQVLMVNRKAYKGLRHPKLRECIVPDFFDLTNIPDDLSEYDACFYCAGISSNGIKEADYSHITLDTTLNFANRLLILNPGIVFCHISGNLADSSEKGKIMWARAKGKTENALSRLPFKKVYNFRPGFMKPTTGQQNVKSYYKFIARFYPLLHWLFPHQVSTMEEVGKGMINSVLIGYTKSVLEISDIKVLAYRSVN
jgi:uncharacterized protein YbjT (DUF2867 family)